MTRAKEWTLGKDYYIRPAILYDLSITDEIVSVINSSFLSEDGWTTDKQIIIGDRISVQDIIDYIYETVNDSKKTVLLLAFKRRKLYFSTGVTFTTITTTKENKKDTVIGTVMMKGFDEKLFSNSFWRDQDDDSTMPQNDIKHYCYSDIYSVLPEYQSTGIGFGIAKASIECARALMGYKYMLSWTFVDRKPEVISYYLNKIGFQLMGILKYPKQEILQDKKKIACYLIRKDLFDSEHLQKRSKL
ncbi:hypothetical protein BDA99DRAFT_537484 [Phascolomyces articulosus]|uniref:Uncharacterized protein n=1 Tax=Phascolomyces articulosus TaxID=60185 RepID=A0AAD5JZQ1_9FUNG|nr:hypothetical protein BDA99DRAFT_537484 [Phascolomyces articulosus]